MKILRAYFARVIRKNWLSFALILFSLCLVSATVYINLCIDADVFHSCEDQMDAVYHGFDASLVITDADDALPADTAFPCADRALAFAADYASGMTADGAAVYACRIRTDLDAAADALILSLCEGRMPAAEDEVLITKSKAEAMAVAVGGVLYLEDGAMTVTGLVADASVFDTAYPNILELFCPLPDGGKCNFFLLDYTCGAETLTASLPLDAEVYTLNVFEIDTFYKTRELKIVFGFILVMIGVIAALVVYSSLTMMIGSQEKAMATFVSVGAGKKTITALLLGEGVTLGLCGCILGVFAGELFRWLVYRFYLAGSGYRPFASPLFLAVAFVFTFLLQVGVTLLSIWRFHARTGKDNLLKIEKENTAWRRALPVLGFVLMAAAVAVYLTDVSKNLTLLFISMGSFFIGFVLAFPAVMRVLFGALGKIFRKHGCGVPYLACTSLCREKIHIRNILLTSLVLSLSFISLFITSSMNEFFTAYRDRYNYDILVRGTNGYAVTEDDCSLVMQYADGVEYIVKEYYEPIYSTINGQEIDRRVDYVMENEDLGGMKYLDFDIRTDSLESGECLMDELMARHYGFSLGDEITVHFQAAEDDAGDFTVTVVGWCDSSIFNDDRETIILSREDYLTHITTSIRRVGIVLEQDVSVSEVLSVLKYYSYTSTLSTYLNIQDVAQYVQSEYDDVARVITLLGFIPVFVTLLSVLGLCNNELLLFAGKKKSYAVLASTCMHRKKLCFLIFTELLLTFLTGIVFALLFDSFFAFLIRDVLYVLFTYTDIYLSLPGILSLTGITFLLLGLGFVFFAGQTMKMDVVKEIRYE